MELSMICRVIESELPTIQTKSIQASNQIIVSFIGRPDVEVALLTPWFQNRLKSGRFNKEDLYELIEELRLLEKSSSK